MPMNPLPVVNTRLPELRVVVTTKAIIMGAIASRDWQPLHHDYPWSTSTGGLPNIVMNYYTQAGWISRYLTDWSGPQGRIARLKLSMRSSICPGDELVISGVIDSLEQESAERCWVKVSIEMAVGERIATTSQVRMALPATDSAPSPWSIAAADWRP